MDWRFLRRVFSFFLAWLMVNPSGPPSGFGKDDAAGDAQRASDVKAAILKLGSGKDARVMLTLRDGERVDGYVNQAQDDSFSVRDFCSGNVIPAPFAHVRGLRGVNVATRVKVSTGKGASAKAAAGLAIDDPCGATIIQVNRIGPNPLIGALIGAALVAFLVTILALANRD
jgi:hypothetical protein